MTTLRFQGRLGIQQRVLPVYRVPFFDQLAASCEGGLSIIAGLPRPFEGIDDGGRKLARASLNQVANVHIGGARQYLVYQRDAARWLKNWKPDVLVMEASARTISNRGLVAAAHSMGRPVVGWGLGVLPWNDLPRIDRIRRRVLRASFSHFDAMIAYSSKAKSDYEALGIPSHKIWVAPNATADPRISVPRGLCSEALAGDAALRRELGLSDGPIVLSVGRLVPGKRVDRLLRVFHRLHADAELIIVGDGLERRSLEQLAGELGVSARFLGDRRAEDLDRIMAAADVFVLPGLGGLALQEALCWGLPVVVAGGDGSETDLVHHHENGFLVPPDDETALLEAIRALVQSREMRLRMGAASLKLVQDGLGSTAMLRAFVEALNELHRPRSSSQDGLPGSSVPYTADREQRTSQPARVTLVCKNPIEDLPPALTTVYCLIQLASNVRVLVSSVSAANKESFLSRGVGVGEVGSPGRPGKAILGRLGYWRRFRREAWRAMSGVRGDELLWISSADTALALGSRLLKRRFVLQVNELYDERPVFRRLLAGYIRAARVVVVPQATRAAMFRHWYRLATTPAVIPNKPLLHPRERGRPLDGLSLPPEFRDVLGRRIVLYQGHVDLKRSLLPVARAFRHLGPEYRLVLMGIDHGAVQALREACPTLVHIPPLPAPTHLLVTSHAAIGVISYSFESLNDLFCAPNKIWEFAGFSIPVVAQRLPGLLPYVEGFHAGVCVDFDRPEEIASAIREAAENEGAYKDGARRLYESVDVRTLIAAVVEQAQSGR